MNFISSILFSTIIYSQIGFASAEGLITTVPNVSIKNFHAVVENKIYRGQAPEGKINDLIKLGITDIIIFKMASQKGLDDPAFDEVKSEIQKLTKAGYDMEKHITHIPFRWKEFPSFKEACTQTIQALEIMKQVNGSQNRKLFFHCTVGEDRTGYLASLWYLLTTERETSEVFDNEMCEHGFEAGDPKKPQNVVNAIRKDLTPVFLKMSKLIKSGDLSYDNLNTSVCEGEPYTSSGGKIALKKIQKLYRCL